MGVHQLLKMPQLATTAIQVRSVHSLARPFLYLLSVAAQARDILKWAAREDRVVVLVRVA
jgi:hypothetical protein